LGGEGQLLSTPFVANKHAKNRTSISAQLWQLTSYMPLGCLASTKGASFDEVRTPQSPAPLSDGTA
jgi:hypothetical protein